MSSVRKPNHQNDRIWATRIEDIEDNEGYREMVPSQAFFGIFIIFTTKKLHWVIKDEGESWTGQYFRDTILIWHVFLFLKDAENVIDVNEVTFVHDKAPCMKANMTQHLIQNNHINFWGNNIWPWNSPDLNAAEHMESTERMLSEKGNDRYHGEKLNKHLCDVLENTETNTELFESLLYSYPSRLEAVRKVWL